MIYPNAISVHGMEGFYATMVTPRETGLPYDLYFECLAWERLKNYSPYFYACKEDWLIPISISDHPFVIDIGIEDSDFASVVEWAEKYKNLLIKHWNGEIEDVDLIFAIRNLHRIDMGKTISDLHLDEDELICLNEAISILKRREG